MQLDILEIVHPFRTTKESKIRLRERQLMITAINKMLKPQGLKIELDTQGMRDIHSVVYDKKCKAPNPEGSGTIEKIMPVEDEFFKACTELTLHSDRRHDQEHPCHYCGWRYTGSASLNDEKACCTNGATYIDPTTSGKIWSGGDSWDEECNKYGSDPELEFYDFDKEHHNARKILQHEARQGESFIGTHGLRPIKEEVE